MTIIPEHAYSGASPRIDLEAVNHCLYQPQCPLFGRTLELIYFDSVTTLFSAFTDRSVRYYLYCQLLVA